MAVEHHSEPTPEITPQAIRQTIEAMIESLIAVLDDTDPDPDLEDGDEDNDKSDFEPALGSLERVSQVQWSHGTDDDCEDEHDGREPCCEDEGAQCDDEGAIDVDREYDYDDEPSWCHAEFSTMHEVFSPGNGAVPPMWRRRARPATQECTADVAKAQVEALRRVMASHGLEPVAPLRVLAGAILKG